MKSFEYICLASSGVSKILQVVAGAVYGLPQITYWSTAASLDDVSAYPTFMRTIPTDDAVSFSICRYWNGLGYRYVNVLYGDNDYGAAFKDSIQKHCRAMGLAQVGAFSFGNDKASVDLALLKMQESKINIVMLVGGDSAMNTYVMEQGYALGLTGAGKMWVLSDAVASSEMDAIENQDARVAMAGSLRVIAAGVTDGEKKWMDFRDAWPTLDESTFNPYLPSWSQLESGFFANTALGPDSDIVKDVGSFQFDAVAALGLFSCMYQPQGQVNKSWSSWIMSDPTILNFDGLSGPVSFAENGNRDSRTANYRMFVTELNGTTASFNLKQTFNPDLDAWELTEGAEMRYNGNILAVPKDTNFEEDLNSAQDTKTILYLMVVFLMGELTFCLCWTFVFRKTAIVRSSQTKFLVMFVVGGYISAMSIIPMTFDDVDDVQGLSRNGTYEHANTGCTLTLWLYTTGFALMYAPLFAKMWRVHKLFSNKSLKRVNIPNGKLLVIVMGIAGIQAVVMLIFQMDSPLNYLRITLNTDNYGRITESYGTCTSEGQASYLKLIFSAQLIFLLGRNYLGYVSRNINTSFSEGKYM